MEATKEAKKSITEQEITIWANTAYQWTLRARVAKKTGNKEMEENAVKEAANCEAALDALKEELELLIK